MSEQRTGGRYIVIEGRAVRAPKQVPAKKKDDGTVVEGYTALDVAFFGGSAYIKLRLPQQAAAIREGAWVKFECEYREFKGNAYTGSGVLIEVEGKRVDGLKPAA